MRLWTIQPKAVYDLVMQTGSFICDPEQCSEPDYFGAYQWLANQMTRRLGAPPKGDKFPVWAWHTQNSKHAKPDLRRERWGYGPGDEDYTCMELEIPDNEVLLSDFDAWITVLNNYFITDSEEEYNDLEAQYAQMSEQERRHFLSENWERVFNISYLDNDWTKRGDWIQATFWVLKKEYVRKVQFFRTAHRKTT